MKTIKNSLTCMAVLLMLFYSETVLAQSTQTPKYMTSTTLSWNQDKTNIDMDEWKAIEQEYLEKVIKKNEYILASSFYKPQLSGSSGELILVRVYGSWMAIEKAAQRNLELEKAAWGNEQKLKEFKKKQRSFYSHDHSDEIYSVLPIMKEIKDWSHDMVCYVRTQYLTFPEDGKTEEVIGVLQDDFDKMVKDNNLIKGFFTYRHAWGANGSELKNAYFLSSISDLDKMFQNLRELEKNVWQSDAALEKHQEMVRKYFVGTHTDNVYTFVSGLSK
ncbi:hypothetical protein F6U93_08470 [Tamlana haliotis]|uniref:NIPSNAP domain-containing protein n=1 Tax=Pseudotamlana haliotis TaxID=2614804 RepID=A0A6N6MGA4_9FLAO|nr:hypothetical protein [Tamlana haliotis]KAB1067965.1 hypothetical protein F6U93_08470 [Tamlana haliotis]